jgi:hypothetical protein
MRAYGRLFSSPESPVYSFRTPRIISQTGTGIISSSGAVYLSGGTASGVTYGTGIQTIILTESGSSRVTTTLPLRGLTITSSSAWDGVIQSPTLIASATGISLGATSTGVQSIYMIGGESVSLALSGGVATISMQVSGTSGSILPVYRSPNLATPWAQIATCTVTG